jgi:hypothetical protein
MKISFTKQELLSLIDGFEKYSGKLEQPFVSWDCDGVLTPDEARKEVEKGFVPKEAVVFCAKRQDDHYWDSIFIEKAEDGFNYLISLREMGWDDDLSSNLDDVARLACCELGKYISA